MKKLLLLIIFLSCWTLLPAQLSYGTTGLLHAPSADMQKDKTVMLGGNFLHQELTKGGKTKCDKLSYST